MHRLIFFNQELKVNSAAEIPALSSAALYGKGIFTTALIKEKKAFLWDKHWRRLNENAEKIGVDLSNFSERFLTDALGQLIEKNEIENARARITFFDESAGGGVWHFETKRKTNLLITTADSREVSQNFRLTVSPYSVNSISPLAGVKSCNYLENILALAEAKKRGFDEAVRVNERGEIVSACMANIFWRANERLYTPSLKTGCLAGTTREYVLENETAIETESSLDALKSADEIFLTSAGLGMCRVYEYDGKMI